MVRLLYLSVPNPYLTGGTPMVMGLIAGILIVSDDPYFVDG